MRAPVIVFAYNRPDHLSAVLAALSATEEADQTKLYIYCDGPKTEADNPRVKAVRDVARRASGFLDVSVVERSKNLGLSASILAGVSEICESHGQAIVLEDDVLPHRHFLRYVNDALDRYRDHEEVFSIGCHTFDAGLSLPETFFLNIPDCWGWAIWQRSWKTFQSDGAALLHQLIDRDATYNFDFDGTYPYTQMLRDQISGYNQSWAVRIYAHAFLAKKLVLYPRLAVTSNIGFDGSGSHGGGAASYSSVTSSDRPIEVLPIALQECAAAREAWKVTLKKMLGSSHNSLVGRMRSKLRQATYPIVSYLRRLPL